MRIFGLNIITDGELEKIKRETVTDPIPVKDAHEMKSDYEVSYYRSQYVELQSMYKDILSENDRLNMEMSKLIDARTVMESIDTIKRIVFKGNPF